LLRPSSKSISNTLQNSIAELQKATFVITHLTRLGSGAAVDSSGFAAIMPQQSAETFMAANVRQGNSISARLRVIGWTCALLPLLLTQ
jgi:hypothetical protein